MIHIKNFQNWQSTTLTIQSNNAQTRIQTARIRTFAIFTISFFFFFSFSMIFIFFDFTNSFSSNVIRLRFFLISLNAFFISFIVVKIVVVFLIFNFDLKFFVFVDVFAFMFNDDKRSQRAITTTTTAALRDAVQSAKNNSIAKRFERKKSNEIFVLIHKIKIETIDLWLISSDEFASKTKMTSKTKISWNKHRLQFVVNSDKKTKKYKIMTKIHRILTTVIRVYDILTKIYPTKTKNIAKKNRKTSKKITD